jgi:LPS-assembly lipoprotein
MKQILCAILFSTILLLTACGFTPLYGKGGAQGAGVQEKFQQVQIANIPDRPGQILRNNLVDRLYHDGAPAAPRYMLSVAGIQQKSTALDITPDSSSTRSELRLLTTLNLKEISTGKILMTRDLLAVASYDVLGNEYTTLVTQESVRENALNDLAQQIETQLALYFNRAP